MRLIGATNKNLEAAVADGEFRADLYYRINVMPDPPAAAARTAGGHRLARARLPRPVQRRKRPVSLTLAMAAVEVLQSCDFPGNVRELENCVRRTATLTEGSRIGATIWPARRELPVVAVTGQQRLIDPSATREWLPSPSRRPVVRSRRARVTRLPTEETNGTTPVGPADRRLPEDRLRLTDKERRRLEAMESAGWVQAKAARILGLTPRQIGYALRKYRIEMKRL